MSHFGTFYRFIYHESMTMWRKGSVFKRCKEKKTSWCIFMSYFCYGLFCSDCAVINTEAKMSVGTQRKYVEMRTCTVRKWWIRGCWSIRQTVRAAAGVSPGSRHGPGCLLCGLSCRNSTLEITYVWLQQSQCKDVQCLVSEMLEGLIIAIHWGSVASRTFEN